MNWYSVVSNPWAQTIVGGIVVLFVGWLGKRVFFGNPEERRNTSQTVTQNAPSLVTQTFNFERGLSSLGAGDTTSLGPVDSVRARSDAEAARPEAGSGPSVEDWKGLFLTLSEGGSKFQRDLLASVLKVSNDTAPDAKKIERLRIIFEVELGEVIQHLAEKPAPTMSEGPAALGSALINKALGQKKQALQAAVKVLERAERHSKASVVFREVEEAIRHFTSD